MTRSILPTAAACLLYALPLSAQAPENTTELLTRARTYQYQFRVGQTSVVPEFVATVETALRANPDSDALWNAMGVAYLAQAARALLPGGKFSEAAPAIQKGTAALERATEINPNNAEALVTLGAMRAMLAAMRGKQEEAANGVSAMNRAVEIAPTSVRVRLQRAFSGLSLPSGLRDHQAEIADLEFLVQFAGGSLAGEYVRILEGDLYFELEQSDLARQRYQLAAASNTDAAAVAELRLAALSADGVAAADIRKLRQAAGSQCIMCHGGNWDTQQTH